MNNWARNSVGRYAPMGATADDLPAAPPSGKKTIDSTTEVDVAAYATAQVVDANLTAENIKKDTIVLGITGSYEGGGGSSDFSTATITIVDPDELMETFYGPVIVDGRADHVFHGDPSDGITVILYDGKAVVEVSNDNTATVTTSGDVTQEYQKYIVTGNATFTFSAH